MQALIAFVIVIRPFRRLCDALRIIRCSNTRV